MRAIKRSVSNINNILKNRDKFPKIINKSINKDDFCLDYHTIMALKHAYGYKFTEINEQINEQK